MELQTFTERYPVRILFADPGKLARKVIKRSNARMTNKYPSWKMQNMIHCESENERNAMLLIDVCPWVKSYRAQPCVINYLLDGQQCLHYPDILVETKSGSELWEIKTTADAARPEIAKRTKILTELLPAYGYEYRVLLAEHLKQNPRLGNAEHIKKLGCTEISSLQREHIRTLFQQFESLPWGMFQMDPINPYLARHICRMALEGELFIDIDQILTESTPVRWVFNQLKQGGTSWESLISKKAL